MLNQCDMISVSVEEWLALRERAPIHAISSIIRAKSSGAKDWCECHFHADAHGIWHAPF